jgi:hypothetical protein
VSPVSLSVRLALLAPLAVFVVGCKASVSANVKTGEDEVADFDKPLEGSMQAQGDFEDPPAGGFALLGARQDLAFRGPATKKCQCLSVALGQPRDASFEWAAGVPSTDPGSQLVIAISSESCPAAGESAPGASYWGYKADGPNVVVVVEHAVPGRPIASGAIIPKPLGDGQVYIEPVSKKVAYGKATDGGATRCLVGNPGAARTAEKSAPGLEPGGVTDKTAPAGQGSGGIKRIGGQAEPEPTAEMPEP